MKDTGRPILHLNAMLPHPEDETMMQFMCYANPVLLTLLMSAKLHIFIDATFPMTPSPFYQTFIVMVYDRQTMMYVPVMYFLMTHKVQELYMHVFQQIIVLSKYRINVNFYTSDFERAIINAAKHYFPEGFHNGCFSISSKPYVST